MKLIIKGLFLSISTLTCVQPAAAFTLPSFMTKKAPIALSCAALGYGIGYVALGDHIHNLKNIFSTTPYIKNLFSDPDIDAFGFSSKEKAILNKNIEDHREGTVRLGLDVLGSVLEHNKMMNPLAKTTLASTFNFKRSWDDIKKYYDEKGFFTSITDFSVLSVYGISGAISAWYVNPKVKDRNPIITAGFAFLGRSFRNNLLESIFRDQPKEIKKTGKALADVFDIGITALYSSRGILSDVV